MHRRKLQLWVLRQKCGCVGNSSLYDRCGVDFGFGFGGEDGDGARCRGVSVGEWVGEVEKGGGREARRVVGSAGAGNKR